MFVGEVRSGWKAQFSMLTPGHPAPALRQARAGTVLIGSRRWWPTRRMPVGSGETSWGVSDPVRVFTPRGSGAIGQGPAVLHEGGVLLADRWVYSTRVRVACSTDNPWSVHPPSCSSRPEQAPTGSDPLIEHHKGQKRGRGVQICDKGSDRSHPDGAQPHDSKVFHDAVWELEVLCHRSGHQQADSLDVLRHHIARTDDAPSMTCTPVSAPTCVHLVDKRHMPDRNGANCRTGGAPHGLSERCRLPG